MFVFRSIFHILLFLFDLLVFYFFITIVGLYWVRNGDEPISNSGIPVIIHGDGFHTELYLPIEDSVLHHNWFSFINDSAIIKKHLHNKFFTIGWAEEDWSIAGTTNRTNVLMALETLIWPWNKSIMHVQFMDEVHNLENPFTKPKFLNATRYQQLIDFIKSGFVLKDGKPVVKSYKGYYGFDYFFSSHRKYNAFSTCNQWTAGAPHSCNIRNPALATFGWSIAYHLR